VSLIDDWIGRIIAALQQQNLLNNTLILFASDHGEMLFEFGRTGKSLFYEPVTHVPLIIVPPDGAETSRVDTGLAEVFDIAPTILDYAGMAIPANMAATTLRPRVAGQAPGKALALCHFIANDRSSTGVCLRTAYAKYIQWTGPQGQEFYDLKNDPLERRNLINDPSSRDAVDLHRFLLIERLATTGVRCSLPTTAPAAGIAAG
jgi:arylsulfatase A-like enzyme